MFPLRGKGRLLIRGRKGFIHENDEAALRRPRPSRLAARGSLVLDVHSRRLADAMYFISRHVT